MDRHPVPEDDGGIQGGWMLMRKLLFFYAPWCPPCRFYEKEFISFLEKIVGKDQIQRVDAQADPLTAEKYHVDKLPTVVLLDGATVRMNRTGAIDVNEVANWLKGE